MADSHAKHAKYGGGPGDGPLARTALRFTAFTEKWLPDAFGFVLVGTFVVLLFGLFSGEPLLRGRTIRRRPRASAWSTPGGRASGA